MVNIIEFYTINFITRSKISKIAIQIFFSALHCWYGKSQSYREGNFCLHMILIDINHQQEHYTNRDKNFTHPLCSLPGFSNLFRNLASLQC